MSEWLALAKGFEGWTLTEIKELSPRERNNWLELAKEFKRVVMSSG